MNPSNSLFEAILDSLESQIAVIDQNGTIEYVNRAWKQFAVDNGLSAEFVWVGTNYLKACKNSADQGDSLVSESIIGIRSVLSSTQKTYLYEYPCNSLHEERWFIMRIKALTGDTSQLFVITHQNVTQRKQAEQKAEMLSRTDPLTGLFNRRQYEEFLKNEWRRAMRSHTPISIIMFDTDHFKRLNDELGHLAGDECLCKVGVVLTSFAKRPNDLVVRFGGDEFAVILGNTDALEACRIAESIRNAVYELNMTYSCNGRITVSAGVASMIPAKEQPVLNLIRNADKSLYKAKELGRNMVVMDSGELLN